MHTPEKQSAQLPLMLQKMRYNVMLAFCCVLLGFAQGGCETGNPMDPLSSARKLKMEIVVSFDTARLFSVGQRRFRTVSETCEYLVDRNVSNVDVRFLVKVKPERIEDILKALKGSSIAVDVIYPATGMSPN
jgi:hypothetical protein